MKTEAIREAMQNSKASTNGTKELYTGKTVWTIQTTYKGKYVEKEYTDYETMFKQFEQYLTSLE